MLSPKTIAWPNMPTFHGQSEIQLCAYLLRIALSVSSMPWGSAVGCSIRPISVPKLHFGAFSFLAEKIVDPLVSFDKSSHGIRISCM